MADSKENEIVTLPDDWDIASLGSLCDITTGRKDVNEGNPKGAYPFFTCSKNTYYSDVYSFDTEAILVAGNGEVGLTKYYKGKFEAYQRTYVLSNFKPNAKFLYYYILCGLKNKLSRDKSGSTMPYVRKGDLSNFSVCVPHSTDEQQNIVLTLTQIQSAIENQEKIIQTTMELKKALMQKLFTEGLKSEPQRETEIGLVPESWEVVPMSQVIIDTMQNGAFIKKPKYGKGILYVNVEDIYESAFINYDTLQKIDVAIESVKNYLLKENDIVFVRSSLKRDGIGQSCLIANLKEPTFYDCHLIKISPNQNKIVPEYLVYYWRSNLGKTELIRRSKTTTMTTINQQSLAQAMLPLPSIREQKEISNILDGIDRKIETASSKKKVFTTLFKSMLHHLMTGQTRVKDLKLG